MGWKWSLTATLVFAFAFASIQVFANCLPPFEVDASELKCKADTDCVLVGDGCRSCQVPVVVNQIYKAKVERRDERERVNKGCILTCEACQPPPGQPLCLKQRCVFRAVK